jgi:hypothetical protein
MKARSILLVAVVAIVGVVASGATQASASSAPIVIQYEKTCNEFGYCEGTATYMGATGTFEMQVTSFRATGMAGQLTVTECIEVGDISFTAEMNGHASPAGFIVLNGTVTEAPLPPSIQGCRPSANSFVGAQVHQRSDFVGGDATTTVWTGELQLMPASA